MPKTVPTKPYDWTYTTTYTGHTSEGENASSSSTPSWSPVDQETPSQTIPLAELTRQDPILFYAEIPLFEDELHDNGSSGLLIRIVRAFSLFNSLTSNAKLELTVPTASDAHMFLHTLPLHTPSRQRPLPNTRYTDISFFLVQTAHHYSRNQRMGSTLRCHQKGMASILFLRTSNLFQCALATSQERRPHTADRSGIYSQIPCGHAIASLTARRRQDWLERFGHKARVRGAAVKTISEEVATNVKLQAEVKCITKGYYCTVTKRFAPLLVVNCFGPSKPPLLGPYHSHLPTRTTRTISLWSSMAARRWSRGCEQDSKLESGTLRCSEMLLM